MIPKALGELVQHLVAQRVFAIALGYEDLNDHDGLRRDPLLASVVGEKDPSGSKRGPLYEVIRPSDGSYS